MTVEMENKLIDSLTEYLRGIGIRHPVYLFTAILVPWLVIKYRYDFRVWRTLQWYQRLNLLAVLGVVIISVALCILTAFGLFQD